MDLAGRPALDRAPRWTWKLAIAGGLVFLALVLIVAMRTTRDLDYTTTLAFQSLASEPLDLLVNWHTLLGQLVVTVPLSLFLALVAWRRYGGWAWLAPLALLATGPIELVFKLALVHPGPPEELTREFFNPLGVRVEAPSSFPSGHLARLTFLAVLVAGMFPSRASWIGAAAFVAVALFARIYIGDHWLSDALGGMCLGAAVAGAALGWVYAQGPWRRAPSSR
jgi:undecaprenyl-diphosphatase